MESYELQKTIDVLIDKIATLKVENNSLKYQLEVAKEKQYGEQLELKFPPMEE